MTNSIPVRGLAGTAACLAGLLTLPCASAQALDERDRMDERWRFQVTPYVWLTGLEGRVRPFRGAPTARVDKSFSDLLRDLDAAAFLTGTARKGRYVLQGDFSYASSSDTASLPLGLSANARVRQTSLTLAGGYNWSAGNASSLDLLAGVRVWDIKATVQVPGLLAARSATSFADPIVAMRWRYDFAPRWSTLVYADVGGFGIASEATWQFVGSVNYQVRDNLYASLGYRHLSVNYRDDGKRLDFSLGGPVLGATLRF